MMKRLIRQAENKSQTSIDNALQGVADNGRAIMQALEKLKFEAVQCQQLTNNNDDVNKKISQNADIIDKVMSGLYNVCFNLENIDTTPLYTDNQISLEGNQDEYNINTEMPIQEPEESTDDESSNDENAEGEGDNAENGDFNFGSDDASADTGNNGRADEGAALDFDFGSGGA